MGFFMKKEDACWDDVCALLEITIYIVGIPVF